MDHTLFDTDHLSRTYFKLSIPVVLNMVISLIYNLADTFFVTQTGNLDIVAAVSLCSPIFLALMAFGNIYGQGGSSLISRMLGAGDTEGSRRVSSFCFYAAIVTGIVVGLIFILFCSPFLKLLGASTNTFAYARQYYLVMAIGAPFVVLSFIHSNLLRCEGMATQSMFGSVMGTVLNIILDPILISACNMGAFGAAIATVLGYLSSDVFFLIILLKKSRTLSVSPKQCRVSGKELSQIFGVGITAAISNLMQSAATILLNQFLLPYGDHYIAAMGIVMKVVMIAQTLLIGFSFGGVPLYGYLFGANDREKLRQLIRFCLCFLGGVALVFSLILFVLAPQLVGIFLEDQSLIGIAVHMLRLQVIGTVFMAIVLLITVLFQAIGAVVPAFVMSISRQGVVFILALLVMNAVLGYNGILAAQAVSDVFSAAIGGVLCLRVLK